MYFTLIVVLLASGGLLASYGARRSSRLLTGLGAGLVAATAIFFALLSFWGELLWFEQLGYEDRFWTSITAQIGFAAMGAVAGTAWIFLLTPGIASSGRRLFALLGAGLGAWWGAAHWETILLYVYRVPTEVTDPIFERSTAFYLFRLPWWDAFYYLLLGLTGVAVLAGGLNAFGRNQDLRRALARSEPANRTATLRPLLWSLAALGLVVAWGKLLNRYHLLYSPWGAVRGAGWTDVQIRLPAYWIAAGATVLLAALPLWSRFRSWVRETIRRTGTQLDLETAPIAVPWGGILAVWALSLVAVPMLIQWLRVEPNEITLERPYIGHNIDFTRRGFRLHDAEEKRFPASETFTREVANRNRHLLSEIRLWDWRALDAVYEQFQEIRLYYEFNDVDIDRYHVGDRYRQVMISAREMEIANLPEDSQTFVNRRFKYTHGYGVTLTPVSDFTSGGLPNLLIKDIPPKSAYPELEVDHPQIYYGELTDSHVYVNTEEEEFDYPSGDENAYVRYSGTGGVPIGTLWRKFLFGWKFDGTRFFLSGYPKPGSRIQFYRQVRERVHRLAPFLELDRDPYVVLSDGKLYWIVDAYTTSRDYPYSEPLSARQLADAHAVPNLIGVNYIRNSVKAVVDAFNGEVRFYVFDEQDPLIRVWARIFPDLFHSKEEMPDALQAHVRYPTDFLLTQGIVYSKYHMTDPAVFYNQEDLWVRATERYYERVQPVQPYYVMWELPESDDAEFTLILPFTPKNRQVLIGWMAGLSDPGNYGRLLTYKFGKDKRVLGPQQVETKIDQDRYLAGQLTLWDQRGSRVIRGNVLAIPIDDTLLYVEPIYLQAETAAYPELRLVVLMHGDRLSYAESFDEALEGLFGEGTGRSISSTPAPGDTPPTGEWTDLAREASQALERYLDLQGQHRFVEAAKELGRLERLLQQLAPSSESR